MTHILKRPFVTEDPERLDRPSQIVVKRVTTGKDGVLLLQGQVVKADGSKGAIRTFKPAAVDIAHLVWARVLGYTGYAVRHGDEFDDEALMWARVKERLEKRC